MNRLKLLAVALLLLALSCNVAAGTARVSRAHTEAGQWKMALPGYNFTFPRDYASHDAYKTEWWYYTGHLHADDGTKYGYELTFFRLGMDVTNGVRNAPWAVPQVYLAHFAVTNLSRREFFHSQKLNRPGVQVAGASESELNVWNENWTLTGSQGKEHITANTPDYAIDFQLVSEKPPVINGQNGVSQKADCVGCASHYFSLTRLATEGVIADHGIRRHVKGASWMDHEFGSNQLTAEQVGWDWFSIQLDDRTELMLYVMRRRDGSLDKHSSGTWVDSSGKSQFLPLEAYRISSRGTWQSPHTGAVYPMGWRVAVPSLKLDLKIDSLMQDQELVGSGTADVTYWEGASDVNGTVDGRHVHGQAYVEMTGYDKAFSKRI